MMLESSSQVLSCGEGKDHFARVAFGLGRAIIDHQVELPTGDVGWEVLRVPEAGIPPRKMPVGAHLYNGRSGICIFFAALETIRPGEGWREHSLEAIRPTRRVLAKILASPKKSADFRMGVGGVFGLGSLIYSFARAADFLGDAELLGEAGSLCSLLTEQRLEDDPCADVVSGTAGAVNALLALHRVAPEPLPLGPTPLDLARHCGEKLVAGRVSFEDRPRAWISLRKYPPLSGFSHGASGIACCLGRLYRATGDNRFLRAAREGIDFERTTYSEAHRNWLDLRCQEEASRCLNNWCHGAPGILLSRIETLDLLDDSAIRWDIATAYETTARQEMTPSDHVCCGNMGRVEVLFEAERALQGQTDREVAMDLAEAVRLRAGKNHHFGWQVAHGFDPGFFTGASGIGYTYLRLFDPSFPCILSMA